MKDLNFYKFGMMILVLLFFASCNDEDTSEKMDYGQSFTFTLEDGTPVMGAAVKLYTDKNEMFNDGTPLRTGTTDETGTVHFTVDELSFEGVTFPRDLYILAEKGYYSNINEPAVFIAYSNDYINQNKSDKLPLSLIKSFTTPSKWVFKRSILNNEDITSYTADCSKDDYFNVRVYSGGGGGDGQLGLQSYDGLNECTDFYGIWLFTNTADFKETSAIMQDGYQLPSGIVNVTANDQSAGGYYIQLEIKDDSLYYSADITGGGKAINIYAAEF